jgi:hypothetical protein
MFQYQLISNPSHIDRSNKYLSKLVTDLNEFDHKYDYYQNEFIRVTTNDNIVWECYMPSVDNTFSTSCVVDLKLLDFAFTKTYFDYVNHIGQMYQTKDGRFFATLYYKILCINVTHNSTFERPIDESFYTVNIKSIERFYAKYKIFFIANINKVVDLYQ